jgi:peptidoglycan/LPS O-acetylase OafA/YrhL
MPAMPAALHDRSRMHPPPTPARRPELPALTGLRFVAALHVLLVHALRVQWLPRPLRSAVDAAHTSTSLLFVLSGFILYWVYAGADGRLRGSVREFLAGRIGRVYPLLALSHLLALPLWVASVGWEGTLVPAAAALSGQQGWFPPLAHVLNVPGWAATLLFLAYALFPALLILVRRVPRRALVPAMAGAWLLALLPGALYLLALPHTELGERALFTFPLLRLPEFVFGVLLGAWTAGRPSLSPRAAGWLAAGALAAWGAAAMLADRVPLVLIHNGGLAPVHAALLVALAAGGGAAGRLLASPPLKRLGNAGIGLFLLHLPLLAWLQVLGWLPRPTLAGSAAVFAAYLAVTFALSVLVTERFVTPVPKWARRRFGGPAQAPAPVPAAAPGLAAPPHRG